MRITLEELRAGDAVRGFAGWGCVPSNATRLVRECEEGLYVHCACGQHFLDGQLGDGGHLIGMMRARGRRVLEAE